HLAVEHDRELVACAGQRVQAGRDGAEILRALAVEDDVDGPLSGHCPLARGDLASGGIGDRLAGDLYRPEDVLGELLSLVERARVIAGDEWLVWVRDVRTGLFGAAAVEAREFCRKLRSDPRRVTRVLGLGRAVAGSVTRRRTRTRTGGVCSRCTRGRAIARRSACGGRRGGARGLVARGIRLQHGTELELGARFDSVDRRLVGDTRNRDNNVLPALCVDLCLGHAGGVDALTDDRHGLIELIAR